MQITKLYLGHFGKFRNQEIEFSQGINIIYGENEAGKSTIHAFIRGMLFGIEPKKGRTSKEDIYKKYLPWDYPGAYEGRMDIIYEEVPYQLSRSFLKTNRSFTILNLQTGREVELPNGIISDLVTGLTESTYRNTISIAQLKSRTDEDLANQLRNYITNLSVSKSNEVDVAEAVQHLTNQKKKLEALRKENGLGELSELIIKEEENEKRIDELTLRMKELQLKESNLNKALQDVETKVTKEQLSEMERLPAIIEKYKHFVQLNQMEKELDETYCEVVKKRDLAKKEKANVDTIEATLTEVEEINLEVEAVEGEERRLNDENELLLKKEKICNIVLAFVPMVFLAIGSIFLFGMTIKTVWVMVGCFVIALILFLLSSRRTEKKQARFEEKMKQYMQQILILNGRKRQLLLENNVLEFAELTSKHERLLKQIYSIEYFEQRVMDLSSRRDNLLIQTDELYQEILEYMQSFIPEEVLNDDTMDMLVAHIQNRKQHMAFQSDEINQMSQSCHLELEKVKWELSLLEGNEENLISNQKKYEALLERQQKTEKELEAVKLALVMIEELSVSIHDSFGQELNQVVNLLISQVTNEKYKDIKIDEKLNMKIGREGTYIGIDDLSAGTIDQIYFSLRLAVADLVLGKNKMPIILDDSFAFYDDERVLAALSFLAKRSQCILFSCHHREEKLLSEQGIKHSFIQI